MTVYGFPFSREEFHFEYAFKEGVVRESMLTGFVMQCMV